MKKMSIVNQKRKKVLTNQRITEKLKSTKYF